MFYQSDSKTSQLAENLIESHQISRIPYSSMIFVDPGFMQITIRLSQKKRAHATSDEYGFSKVTGYD